MRISALAVCSIALLFAPYAIAETRNDADKEFESEMMKMHRNMQMQTTGHTDKDFVTMMIPHHQGAVDMAKTELKYGSDPELRHLAETIVDSQEKEIAFMQNWLKQHPK